MYKDVQNSNNVDKQMLIQLVNENVRNDEGFDDVIVSFETITNGHVFY